MGVNLQIIIYIFLILFSVNACAKHAASKHGEQLFANYCSGCHSLNYKNFSKVSLAKKDAIAWFGIEPPDLTLVTKYRGKIWVREYLQGFYYDAKRPFKSNNKLIHNVQMPNILYPLQGNNEYSQNIEEIVTFLDFVADPSKKERYKLGIAVESFLALIILGLLLIKIFT
jgi:ubiquinol-cytochrome c reductase cytochrome c1 subunit